MFSHIFLPSVNCWNTPHSPEKDLYHIMYQMVIFSLKLLTYVYVEFRLRRACFNIKFLITMSLVFQKLNLKLSKPTLWRIQAPAKHLF